MTKATSVPIFFIWEDFKPDQRIYRQQSISLQPNVGIAPLQVQIDVPLGHELIANAEAIIEAKISNGSKPPDPILTLKGVRWITDEFDKVFYNIEEKEDEVKATSDDWGDTKSDDDGWDETPATESQPAKAADEWEEESKSTDKDEAWDEKAEDWGN